MTNSRRATELVVLGGGPGGYVAAIRSAQLGVTTTVVEAAHVGGVCLNEGCVPSKALIHDALEAREDASLGLIDRRQIRERFAASGAGRESTVARLRSGVEGLLRANGVETVAGRGRLVDANMLIVANDENESELRFDELIIATGSEPIVPRGLEIDGSFVLSAREVLQLREAPGRAVVVGGGYIGLELAMALNGFGTEIVVVEATDRMLPGIEPALTDHLVRSIRAQGIDIRTGSTVVAAEAGSVTVDGPEGRSELGADVVVVAVGRRPRTSEIGLDSVAVPTTAAGFLDVDDQLRTAVAHIRAVGDVTPGPALAHRAMAQGRAAAASIAGHPVSYRPAAVPAVVFTTPEIATVGLRLDEALELGLDAREVRFPLAANARGLTLSSDGFGLLVHDAESGLVLGVHLIGPGVGEVISTATLAIEMGAVLDDLAGTIFPHPTLSEVLGELADDALGLPTHTVPRAPRDSSALG